MHRDGQAVRRAPFIEPVNEGQAVGPVEVRLIAPYRFTKVYYTNDGSEPGEQSRLYEAPIQLKKSGTVRALAVFGNGDRSAVTSNGVRILEYADNVRASDPSPGLAYNYYAGRFRSLPDLGTLTPDASGAVPVVGLAQATAQDNYALVFKGYIRVPDEGVYTFSTTSDDGSRLLLHNECVVDNDGRHAPRVMSGAVALKADLHPSR